MRARMGERIADGWPVVRLGDQRAVDAWIASLADDAGASDPSAPARA
jgi:hypothetical protein